MRFLRVLGKILVSLVIALALLWETGALWFDLPVAKAWRGVAAVLFLAAMIFLWIWGKSRGRISALGMMIALAVWWFSLQPSNERNWQPDVAKTAWAEIDGDTITFHNIRNCEYRSATDFTPRWETRTVRLSSITGADMAINYWGSELMAHPIICFRFSDGPPLCFSIETRREVGENYSAIGGFYRQFELIYVVAEERDVLRVRTNYRGEQIYLYQLVLTPEQARAAFLEYVTALNQLNEHAKWYNAATANCTTSIRAQRDASERLAWDWRILLNGYGDQMLYERGAFVTGGLPFADLKARSLINDAAREANDAPDFSERIRAKLPK